MESLKKAIVEATEMLVNTAIIFEDGKFSLMQELGLAIRGFDGIPAIAASFPNLDNDLLMLTEEEEKEIMDAVSKKLKDVPQEKVKEAFFLVIRWMKITASTTYKMLELFKK